MRISEPRACPAERIERVGNIMIDLLEMVRGRSNQPAGRGLRADQGEGYAVVTLHRPATVDDRQALGAVVRTLVDISDRLGHRLSHAPRTAGNLERFELLSTLRCARRIRLIQPVGYVEFMRLVRWARCVITDSGGVQEETTYLDILPHSPRYHRAADHRDGGDQPARSG